MLTTNFLTFVLPSHMLSVSQDFNPEAPYKFRCANNLNSIVSHDWQPPEGLGLLTVEVSGSNSDTPHSVELLWTSDRPVAENPTWQHTITRNSHPCPRRDCNPQFQQASGRRPTPWTARPLGSALTYTCGFNVYIFLHITSCASTISKTLNAEKFDILLTAHLNITLVNDQLDAQFFIL